VLEVAVAPGAVADADTPDDLDFLRAVTRRAADPA
jgi:hypothetical protein